MREQNFDEMLKTGMQEMNEGILPSAQLLADTRARMAQTKPRSKWVPRMQKAVAVAACTLVIFTGAVNLSPAFASAAANVPIVRELVKAVAFDPSMKAAIEHDYVQLVKKTATDNGFTLEVEYLVADPRNLTVYYKMAEITAFNENHYEQYRFDFDLLDMDGNDLEGYGASWDYPISKEEVEALNAVKYNFTGEAILPEQVQVRLIVKEAQPLSPEDQKKLDAMRNPIGASQHVSHLEEPEPEYVQVAEIVVPLTIDQSSLFNVRTLELNQTVDLEGQKVVFDKVEIYDTETLRKTTIGYRSEENTDNIWTGGHGEGEHKLLLGSGDELVSINLRLEYKISDLKKYLKTSAMPEAQMEALAYELVTDQTIATDLNEFMSTDREKFSENFQKELSKKMKEKA